MISLDNVSKTYISKSKTKVRALKNVSFELDGCGMVFILGKSGSGKSTLLNLLGGLDAPSGGVITVDGVSMERFKQDDYDAYRNGYVGFVFQEFNLLPDFNVKDNVALALQLGKETDVDNKVREVLAQVELPEEYLARRVSELSGGERQRVAIARSIIKDSKLILADEPTGNLDSATGESIWKILKKLSETKLVVVVSHDSESAELYADRIIEIADGEVFSDTCAQPQQAMETKFVRENKHLPFSACFKMGANSISRHKWRTATVILLSVLTVLALLITQMSLTFAEEKTYAKFIDQTGVPYFAMRQGYIDDDGKLSHNTSSFTSETLAYLDANVDYIADGIIKNKQQLLDFGFTFVGNALELTSNSFYVSKEYVDLFLANEQTRAQCYYISNGNKVKFNNSTKIENLVGKQVWLALYGMAETDNLPVLAGVVDTDPTKALYVQPPTFFTLKDFESKAHSSSYSFNGNSHVYNPLSFQYGANKVAPAVDWSTCDNLKDSHGISSDMFTIDGKYEHIFGQDYPIGDNDIVLSYGMYAQLFNITHSISYYLSWGEGGYQVLHVPEHLGEKFDFKIYDGVTQELLLDLGEYNLVGVYMDVFGLSDRNTLTVNTHTTEKLVQIINTQREIWVRSASVANTYGFIMTMLNDYHAYVYSIGAIELINSIGEPATSDCVYIVDHFNRTMAGLRSMLGIVCAILAVVLLLMVINLISFSITARKKEIGILTALGANKRDITSIFILETLVIAIISFVLTLVLAIVFATVFNAVYCSTYSYKIPFMQVDIFAIMTLVATTFGLLLLAALIPIRKIAQLKPIDAIRHI